MRLICPNCGAQYEVPTEVIPTEGRDVQCSACSNTWFQAHPDHDAALADEVDTPSVEPVTPPPEPALNQEPEVEEADNQQPPMPQVTKRGLDPQVSDVLRQEAEFEAAARAAEQSAPLESQPDLGLDAPAEDEGARRAREARERMARMRGEPVPDEVAVAAVTAAAGSRRELLPDIEEINSTLRASGERRRPAEATDADLPGTTPRIRRKRHGFKRSFFGVLLLALLAACLYVFGPKISALVPALEPLIEQFTQAIEGARSWLAESVDSGLAWLDKMASENL
ncbi:zinc-ribbon domain-containing protein [Planktotalea sp.]|uniref:zinc-ribbon domain-containing protein n=1 Tax=Planktotalea sp. TaxID=2029877 RepID=UPI003D6C6A96